MRIQVKVLLLGASVGLLWAIQPPAAPVVSVCELLKDRMQYDGKMVTVRGEVDGTSEGTWLSDDFCPEALTILGRDWRRSIALVTPNFAVKPVEFQYDQGAADRLQREFKLLKVDPKKVRMFVTYEGVFETRPDSDLTCGGRACGFGHLGGSPGQLVVRTKRDVAVKPRQIKK